MMSSVTRFSIGCVSFLMFVGCSGATQLVYIIKNDSALTQRVSDCFISISPPPGENPSQFNNKKIKIIFRDSEQHSVLSQEATVSAGDIRPYIDWKGYPKVQLSFRDRNGEAEYILNFSDADNGFARENAN